MSDTTTTEPRIIGTCDDCGIEIFNVDPFERVAVRRIGRAEFATRGVFRCAKCALKARNLAITTRDPNGALGNSTPDPALL